MHLLTHVKTKNGLYLIIYNRINKYLGYLSIALPPQEEGTGLS